MTSEWKEVSLGEAINLKRGYDLPSSQRRRGIYPIYSSSGLTDYHNEYKVTGEGVITGRYGTIGEVFFSDDSFWPLNTTLYVEDFKSNYPKFIYYLLKTITFSSFSDKSAVPGINRNHVHLCKIKIPPLFVQCAIANTLAILDDKIANNSKINHHLTSPRSATDSSPDIRRGKSVSRRTARLRLSSALWATDSMMGRATFANSSIFSFGGMCNS